MRIVGPPYLLVCEFDRSCSGCLLGEELEECGEFFGDREREREFELGFADEDMPKYGEKNRVQVVYIFRTSEDFRPLETLN